MADGSYNASGNLKLARPVILDFAAIALHMRPDEIEQFMAFSGLKNYDPEVTARALMAIPGPTFAVVNPDGLAAVVGGFEPLRSGVYEAWLAGTLAAWERYGLGITRVCRRNIERLLANGAHRVQIISLATRTAAHDWYERGLGMQREAVLRGYGAHGEDALVHARVST